MFREKKSFYTKGVLLMLLVVLMASLLSAGAVCAEEIPGGADRITIEGADEKSEQALEDINSNKEVILFADDAGTLQSNGTAQTDKVVLSYSRIIRYEDFYTRNFRVTYDGKTKVAYCVQPKEMPPAEGTWTAKEYNSSLMAKALYYSYGYPGYDKKLRPYLSKKDLDDDYEDDDGAYALSHMILSYFYDKQSISSDAFLGVSSQTKKVVMAAAELIENSWPDVPDNSALSLNMTKAKAVWDKASGKQKTPVFKLNGHEDNRITVTVPDNVTMVRKSDGQEKSFSEGKKVKVFGGDSFYFTAPDSVSGIYKSPEMSGVIADFQPYLISITGKQNIIFCGKGDADSVSFSIEWVNFGKLNLVKLSELPDITEGNSNYSLEGAEYEIYDSKGKIYDKLVTDKKGEASAKLPYGSYYIKESGAPEGYAADISKHDVNIKSARTDVIVIEKPMIGIPDIIVHKKDKELSENENEKKNENVSLYAATLENAHYTIKYYDGYYNEDTDFSELKPVRSWVVRTDKAGKASLNKESLVSGDKLYVNTEGTAVLPLGTITIQETEAPAGYVIDSRVYVRQIKGDGRTQIVNAFEMLTHEEQIIRGDLKFLKKAEGEDGFLEGIPFRITSKSTGESAVLYTDRNGMASTEKSSISIGACRTVSDSAGALPYDTYIIDEERCEKNIGLQLVKGIEVIVDKNNSVVDLGIITDKRINLHTSACEKNTGNKKIPAGSSVTIRDTVRYDGLEIGKEYVLKGKLMDRSSGKILMMNGHDVTGTATFTAAASSGEECVEFKLDSSNLKGKELVVFEYLYESGELIAMHNDLDSRDQTVEVESDRILLPETGDEFPIILLAGIILTAVSGAMCALRRTR